MCAAAPGIVRQEDFPKKINRSIFNNKLFSHCGAKKREAAFGRLAPDFIKKPLFSAANRCHCKREKPQCRRYHRRFGNNRKYKVLPVPRNIVVYLCRI